MPLSVGVEAWPLTRPFRIARGVKSEAVTVVALVSDGRAVGRGEATPYARYGETPEAVADQVESVRDRLEPLLDDPPAARARLAERLPAGAARNAVDCALWDLQAKQTSRSVADLAGLSPPAAVDTAVTVSLDAPDAMAKAARDAARDLGASLLKAKLGAGAVEDETARLRAIRAAAPKARLIVDANEGWSREQLLALDPICAEIGALFIEQPLPAEQDAALEGLALKTRLCADESLHIAADLPKLKGRFQVVNVKLDKTGGLTGAIALRAAALEAGFEVMIGCMMAGSLAMAPAYLLTAGALAVDLDGPLWLARDREPAMPIRGATLSPPPTALWG